MGKWIWADDVKRVEEQTGVHLLMAGIVSVFSVLLIFVTLAMSWEVWTIPLVAVSVLAVWGVHIGRAGAEPFFEHLCAGILTVEFFYYGVHPSCLFDVPVIACVLLFMLVMLHRKSLLYLAGGTYVLVLLYHLIFLHTIGFGMGMEGFVRLFIGAVGTVSALVLAGSMISRRRAEREKMCEMAQLLEAAKQKNADFLSNVSHELRTPINMVTGISEVALGREMPAGLWESMQSIQMAGRRLAGQINDILDYTEIVGDTLVVTSENYMPSSMVNDIITMAVMQGRNHKLELVFDLDTGIPSMLVGDVEKISRVIRILLQNAIKFTEEGGIYVHVGFRRESYGVNLLIDICDTGIGMTPFQLARIYDDFYQADTGRSRYAGGLGLGIPIARGLLRAMEGFIYYESAEEQGTKVHISIPQGVDDDTPSMVVENPKQFCVACYYRQERCARSEVGQFYDNMVRHMAEGLGIEVHRLRRLEELEKMLRSRRLTHLFLAQSEYEEDCVYFEELGKSICVVLAASKDYVLGPESCLILLQKPFFALPIVNLLNGVTHGKNLGESMMEDRLFFCAGVRALVVDDEEMNLVVAKGILNSYRIRIDTCLSGAAAVELCVNTAYDLIFLDHMMPGMDGVETLKRIRAMKEGAYQNLPIIALTANAISGAREMFKSEGFTEFVPKPIERPVLERVLRKVLPESCIQYYMGTEKESAVPLRERQKQDAVPGQGSVTGEAVEPKAGTASGERAEPGQDTASGECAEPEQVSFLEMLCDIGLNVKLGLGYCGGEEEFYREMLQMYCDQSTSRCEEITALYESGNWKEYAVKVHALKSTSLTIGAEELSGQAKALELAGKSGDAGYILERHPGLLDAYMSICESIRNAILMADSRGGNAL